MDTKRLLYIQLALVAVIGVLHLIGLEYFLYWRLWWYDILLHSLGGAWVALAALWFLTTIGWRVGTLQVLLATIVVGAGWEVWEFTFGIFGEDNYTFDTSLDMFMDMVGAVFVVWITRTREMIQ